jgi:hypothetical protein
MFLRNMFGIEANFTFGFLNFAQSPADLDNIDKRATNVAVGVGVQYCFSLEACWHVQECRFNHMGSSLRVGFVHT